MGSFDDEVVGFCFSVGVGSIWGGFIYMYIVGVGFECSLSSSETTDGAVVIFIFWKMSRDGRYLTSTSGGTLGKQ